MGSVWDIARKQVEDSFSSRKFLAIIALFLIFSLGSVHMGVSNYQQQLDRYQEGSSYGTPEKPSLTEVFKNMMTFNMPLAAAVLALILSYDSISKEREEGTIELLLSYPIYRDEVINGKFIAGMFTLALALFIAFSISTGYAMYATGLIPSIEQISRLSFIWTGSLIYMGFFLGLGTLFSTIFRTSWHSLLVSAILLMLFLGTPIISSLAGNYLYPYPDSGTSYGVAVEEGGSSYDQQRQQERAERERIREQRDAFSKKVSRLSPSTSYSNFVNTMLMTNYRSQTGIKPNLWESLSSSIGYLTYLVSQTLLVFTASYAVFMRQDL